MPEHTEKAWVVKGQDDKAVVVFDDNRNHARRWGAIELEEAYIEVSVKRAKQFDAFYPGPVPVRVLMANGWFWDCQMCQEPTYDDEPDMIVETLPEIGETVFCSADCRTKYAEFLKTLEPAHAR